MNRQLKAKILRTEREVRSAVKEIEGLLKKLDDGTLDRRKLNSGLRKLKRSLVRVPPHAADIDS